MPLGARLFRSFGSALVGKAVTVLCGVGTFAILARQLGAEGLGQYRTVLTLLAFAGMTFDFGLQKIALRDISQLEADQGRIVGGAVALRMALTTAAVLVAAVVVHVSPYDEQVLKGVLVAGGGWLAYQVSELLLAVFQRRLAQHRSALAESIGASTTLGVVFLLSRGDAGAVEMLGATALGWVVAMTLSWAFAFQLSPFKPRVDFVVWRGLLIAGLPVAGSGLLSITHIRADVLLLSLLAETVDVGIYDVSLKLYELVASVPYLLGGILMPLFVADRSGRPRDCARRLEASVSLALIVGGLVATVVMVHAESIATLLAGAGFGSSGPAMRILFVSVLFATVSTLMRFAALAYDLQGAVLKADFVAVSAALVAYLVLIPRFGTPGAAAGKLVGDVGILLGMVLAVGSRLRVSVPRGLPVVAVSVLSLWGLLELAAQLEIHWFIASVLGGTLVGAAVLALPPVRRELAILVRSPERAATPEHPSDT